VLTARTGFLQSGIEEEVGILRRVRDGVEGVYGVGKREFEVSTLPILHSTWPRRLVREQRRESVNVLWEKRIMLTRK
jgi:hypothetical protein